MVGDSKHRGVVPRVVEHLLKSNESKKVPSANFDPFLIIFYLPSLV